MVAPWRVLTVCSAAECRQRLAEIVSTWKIETVSATSIEEADKILREQPISLVFCDYGMAQGSFRDLAKTTASLRSRVYLVALIHNEQEYSEAMQSGAFDAIPMRFHSSDIGWILFHAIRHAEDSLRPAQSRSA
jgi:DNA-binding NtrC family response regulator